jgi:creatinine amidohydrolase/Fe(II)-dependent formamide hydrolase-like protein
MWDTTNTFAEIEASQADVAILPVGAIEQHGRHLPVWVDWK